MQRFKCRSCGHLFQNNRPEVSPDMKCPRCLSLDVDRILDAPANGERREVPGENGPNKKR